MAPSAKKLRFRAEPPRRVGAEGRPGLEEGAGRAGERRGAADRRDPTRAPTGSGVERREGPRRALDLPRPLWQRPLALGLAIMLGVATGLVLGSVREDEPEGERTAEGRAAPVDPELLAGVVALREEAEALTPATVALDEGAHARWLPKLGAIDRVLADPATPELIRRELEATLEALTRAGLR